MNKVCILVWITLWHCQIETVAKNIWMVHMLKWSTPCQFVTTYKTRKKIHPDQQIMERNRKHTLPNNMICYFQTILLHFIINVSNITGENGAHSSWQMFWDLFNTKMVHLSIQSVCLCVYKWMTECFVTIFRRLFILTGKYERKTTQPTKIKFIASFCTRRFLFVVFFFWSSQMTYEISNIFLVHQTRHFFIFGYPSLLFSCWHCANHLQNHILYQSFIEKGKIIACEVNPSKKTGNE